MQDVKTLPLPVGPVHVGDLCRLDKRFGKFYLETSLGDVTEYETYREGRRAFTEVESGGNYQMHTQ